MSASRRSSRLLVLLTTVVALLGAGFVGSPAQAVLDAPGDLTPSHGQAVAGIPVLTWDRVPGATTYDVQVATNPDFAVVKYRTTTTNRRVVPNIELAAGEIWWRVKANSSSGGSDWSTTSFERDTLAGPNLVSPANGATLDPPEDPALLAWEPINGAIGYTIEIDDASDFISPIPYTTKTSSFVVPKPQVATEYYWRVRATLAGGVVTNYSSTRTYQLGGLDKPVLVSPTDSALTSIEDVVLDWRPVAGAASYELQISTDDEFNTIDDERLSVKGTRYSPPVGLPNDQYYWRVRPVDSLGNKLDWADVDVWSFRRHWPDQPVLEYPVGEAVVGDPFYFQWTPVDKADKYLVQISPTGDFQDPAVTRSCVTVHTTFTPGDEMHAEHPGDCYPGAMGTYSWRVIAFDGPRVKPEIQSDAISSEVQTFSYAPETAVPQTMTPVDGATLQVPTLRWESVPGAATYRVSITAVDGGAGSVANDVTAATSYTSRKLLTPGKTYRWSVQPVSGHGRLGPTLTPDSQPRFTVAAMPAPTSSVPVPLGPDAGATSNRMPTLTWTPVQGADYYKIGFRKKGAIAALTELTDKFSYPAGEDTGFRSFDGYEWAVSAYKADGTKVGGTGPSSWLTLDPLPPISGARVALTGQATATTSCTTALDEPACPDMQQTPVLRWDPVRDAGLYKLYVSRDKEMTNLLRGYPRFIDNTAWTSHQALFDSQAGEAFFWSVSPCVSRTVCNAPTHARHAFNKKSKPVELLSPSNGKLVADDVTFDWRDYLKTNLDSGILTADAAGESPRIEARQYRVEVSTVPNFQTLVDTIEVDQTTYTAFRDAYPEGTLYWRVSAIDGSGNTLTSSEVRTFTKSSPAPTLTSPVDNEVVTQTEPFRWQPLDFAASYDIEVYKNGDTVGQSDNKVFGGNSKQAAFTTTSPLPVSDTPYTWRIRRVDASGNPGAWTSLADPAARFRVSGTAPGLTAPSAAVTVAGNDAMFSWSGVTGASAYRFERRAPGATSMAEVVNTPGLAWAPIKTITDGSWQWRVSTLDAAGKVTATSEWRSFTVDGTNPTVTRKSPIGTVRPVTTFALRFSEPVKGVGTTTFRLYKKGVRDPVPSTVTLTATGTQATLTAKRQLRRGATYTVKVLPGVTDMAGNPLAATAWQVSVR